MPPSGGWSRPERQRRPEPSRSSPRTTAAPTTVLRRPDAGFLAFLRATWRLRSAFSPTPRAGWAPEGPDLLAVGRPPRLLRRRRHRRLPAQRPGGASARAGGKPRAAVHAPALAQPSCSPPLGGAAASAGEAVRQPPKPASRAVRPAAAWLTLLAAFKATTTHSGPGRETEKVTAASALGVFQGAVRDVSAGPELYRRRQRRARLGGHAARGTPPSGRVPWRRWTVSRGPFMRRRNSAPDAPRLRRSPPTPRPLGQARVTHAHGLLSRATLPKAGSRSHSTTPEGPAPVRRARTSWPMGVAAPARRRSTPGPTSRRPRHLRELGAAPWPSGPVAASQRAGRPPARPFDLSSSRRRAAGGRSSPRVPTREAPPSCSSARTVEFHLRNVFAKPASAPGLSWPSSTSTDPAANPVISPV